MVQPETTLPDAALSHMPEHVFDKLPDFLQPEFVFQSTSADETFEGHAGVVDYFVFDHSTSMGSDTIIGFEPLVDFIVFENHSGKSDIRVTKVGDCNIVYTNGDVLLVGVTTPQFNEGNDFLLVSGEFLL